jgi:hypothetical protein
VQFLGEKERNFKTHASGYENPRKTWLRAILAAKSATSKRASEGNHLHHYATEEPLLALRAGNALGSLL